MNYGINYLGSKNSIAPSLVQYIVSSHPDKKYFIDACCGGFAISHYVLKETGMKVLANDLNPYVMDLFEELFNRNGTEFAKVENRWITHERYADVRDNPDKYPKWLVGYVLTNWSFGGRGDSYLYAVDKEPEKRALFDALVNDIWTDGLKSFYDTLPKHLKEANPTNPNKRKALLLYYERHVGKQMQLENQSRMERLLNLVEDVRPNAKRLRLSAMDYHAFIDSLPRRILENAVIYFDPPYEDTATYYTNDMDYIKFWSFVTNLAGVAPVYVSSYTAPSEFREVWSTRKKVNLDNPNNREFTRKFKIERLFYNGYMGKEILLGDML